MSNNQDYKNKVFRGGVWALSGKIISIFCAFILNLVIARSLDPSEYGAYFIAVNTIIILATVGTVGMDQVVVRYVAKYMAGKDIKSAFKAVLTCLLVVLSATTIVCIFLYIFGRWFFDSALNVPALGYGLVYVVLWLFLATIQRQLAETFRGFNDIRSATLFGGVRNNGIIVSIASCLAISILWYLDCLSLTAVLVVSVGAALLVVIISGGFLWHIAPPESRVLFHDNECDHSDWSVFLALREGWPLWIAVLVMILRLQGSGWLTGIFDTPDHVALYGVAQRFVYLITAPLVIVNAILPPLISELYERKRFAQLEKVVRTLSGLASIPSLAIFAVLLAGGKLLLGLLFGNYYVQAYPLLMILCAAQVANIATGSWQIVLPMTGRRKAVLCVSIVAAVVQLVCGCVGGYLFGVYGVAVGFFIGIFVSNVAGVWAAYKTLGVWTFVSINYSSVKDVMRLSRSLLSGDKGARSIS